jgi:tricorn protease
MASDARQQAPRTAPSELSGAALLLAVLYAAGQTSAAAASTAQIEPSAVMLRTPDVSADQIVFRYADDLWLCPRGGGEARRNTSAAGAESFPRFSPDGRRVAFMGQYQGESDLYVLDLEAGIPQRVTFHPGAETLCGWTPDGQSLLYHSSELAGLRRAPRLMSVSVSGGEPTPLPLAYGTFGALDDSGEWLAFTPSTVEFRTWKRYQGGLAQDLWLYNLRSGESRRLTDFAGADAQPMWHGKDLLFTSDRGPGGILNLWRLPAGGGEPEQLTFFNDFGIRFPSIGPNDVVFENGGQLYLLSLANKQLQAVEVSIPGDRPTLMPVYRDLSKAVRSVSPSPTGKRLWIEARGEIFSVPSGEGVVRNLTRSSAYAERGPALSPDGKRLAYLSDESGELEVWLASLDGQPFPGSDERGRQRLTSHGAGYRQGLSWSPDSKKLIYTSNDGGLWVLTFESGEPSYERIAVDPDGQNLDPRWSPHSDWLCYAHRSGETRLGAVYLYHLPTGFTHQVTSGRFDDSSPSFSPDGKYLYYSSARHFAPRYADLDETWIYAGTRRLVTVPLRADVEHPLAPVDDQEPEQKPSEETGKGDEPDHKPDAADGSEAAPEGAAPAPAKPEEPPAEGAAEQDPASGSAAVEEPKAESDAKPEDKPESEPKTLEIELQGFEARGILLPVPPGSLTGLTGLEGGLLYLRLPEPGASAGPGATLERYDLEAAKRPDGAPKTVLAGVEGYELLPDGKQLLVFVGGRFGLIQASEGQKLDKPVDLSGLGDWFDPRAEWRQMLVETWRLFRDFFYDEKMHGLDWIAVRERYLAALPDATSRGDLSFLTAEMMSDLNVGHAYNGQAPLDGIPAPAARPAGLLGADVAVENGAHRIRRLLHGGAHHLEARSPLLEHGVGAAEGDYLLAVDGRPLDPARSHLEALLGKAGRTVELTLNREPRLDGQERRVLVRTLADDGELRLRDWVRQNRERVESLSGGRIGYVYVPNTGFDGQNELVSQFLGSMHEPALLIDDRWNGGGQIPTRFIELLNRPMTNFWAVRHGEDWQWPPVAHRGPKAMLINGWAGSGGDAFPYYFRQAGLGKLYGTRTWGGLVGISGNPELIDGTEHSVPRFAFYELDGTWGVEGHGVDPDVAVIDDPAALAKGGDPQLEAAVRGLLAELEAWPGIGQKRPAPPDRSGAGIPEADR